MQLRSYVLYAGSSLWISPSKCLELEPKWHCHFGIPRQHRRLYHVSTLMVGRLGDLWEWTVLNHQQGADAGSLPGPERPIRPPRTGTPLPQLVAHPGPQTEDRKGAQRTVRLLLLARTTTRCPPPNPWAPCSPRPALSCAPAWKALLLRLVSRVCRRPEPPDVACG